jgi:hypothetical protein
MLHLKKEEKELMQKLQGRVWRPVCTKRGQSPASKIETRTTFPPPLRSIAQIEVCSGELPLARTGFRGCPTNTAWPKSQPGSARAPGHLNCWTPSSAQARGA